jgi:hypothetical protein
MNFSGQLAHINLVSGLLLKRYISLTSILTYRINKTCSKISCAGWFYNIILFFNSLINEFQSTFRFNFTNEEF